MFSEEEFNEYWKGWSEKEESNYTFQKNKSGKEVRKYLKKGYTHFDNRFWFPENKEALKKILQKGLKIYNKQHKREEWWAFAPFLKILLKTPRYKYQQEEGLFDLETKIRPICFASHMDALIFGFYAYALTKKYEKYLEELQISDCVLAYRSNMGGKCNIQFTKEVFEEIRNRKNCSAIALDIKGYFDHIDHGILKQKWTDVLGNKLPEDQFKIFKSLTTYSYVSYNTILKRYDINLKKLPKKPNTLLDLIPGSKDFEKFQNLRNDKVIVTNTTLNKNTKRPIGIPQGSGMSALLSNIYLVDFDKHLFDKSKDEGFMYRRYCDDILIICDSDKAEQLQKYVIELIDKDYHQEIQSKKVELTEFRPNSKGKIRAFNKKKMLSNNIDTTDSTNEKFYYKSLQYLGFEFNGQDIFIRSSSVSRYFRKMKARIIKTISMAYSRNSNPNRIWKKQIFERYTHLGKRNFLTYAYNAAKPKYMNADKELKDGLDSKAIVRQLSRHIKILSHTIEDKNMQRFAWKSKKGKAKKPKKV